LTLEADVSLVEIAGFLPETVTGADLGGLSSAAYSRALERKLEQLRADAERNMEQQLAPDTSPSSGK
jgi:hypothetical protein